MSGSGYYADNLLTELAELRARVATLEKALPAARMSGAGVGGLGSRLAAGISSETPTGALPQAGDIPPVYFIEVDTRDIYQGVVQISNGKPRFYLQRIGRSREE